MGEGRLSTEVDLWYERSVKALVFVSCGVFLDGVKKCSRRIVTSI